LRKIIQFALILWVQKQIIDNNHRGEMSGGWRWKMRKSLAWLEANLPPVG